MWYGFLEDQDFLTCCSVSSIVFIRLNKANRSCLLFFFCPDLFSEVHFRIPPRGVSSEMNFRNTTFSENVTLFRSASPKSIFYIKKNTFSEVHFQKPLFFKKKYLFGNELPKQGVVL